MKKILVINGSGYIGSRLFSRLGPQRAMATYHATPVEGGCYFDPLTMRIKDLRLDAREFSHAVLLYGITNPDQCARDQAASRKINVESMQPLITELNDLQITPVFASTEVVFDGGAGNYAEAAPVAPRLVYAVQKVAVENHIRASGDKHIIVRLAKVYGTDPDDSTLLVAWLRAMLRGESPIRAADDFISSVLHIADAVEFLIRLMEKNEQGIFHLGGPSALSRFAICRHLLHALQEQGLARHVKIHSCSIAEFPTIEKRPRDISFNITKTTLATGYSPRTVQSACRELVQKIQSAPVRFANLKSESFSTGNRPIEPPLSSLIRINQMKNLRLTTAGRTPAFFGLRQPIRLNATLIRELQEYVQQNRTNARICLHLDPTAAHHDMIIAEQSGLNYRPHRHASKGETWHIIDGRLGVAVFDEQGEIIDAAMLSPGGNLIYRLGLGMYHAVMPLSDIAVYHENKPGPFLSEGDSIFPSWSPEENDHQAREDLRRRILTAIAQTENRENHSG